jgi:hypothetical protein
VVITRGGRGGPGRYMITKPFGILLLAEEDLQRGRTVKCRKAMRKNNLFDGGCIRLLCLPEPIPVSSFCCCCCCLPIFKFQTSLLLLLSPCGGGGGRKSIGFRYCLTELKMVGVDRVKAQFHFYLVLFPTLCPRPCTKHPLIPSTSSIEKGGIKISRNPCILQTEWKPCSV